MYSLYVGGGALTGSVGDYISKVQYEYFGVLSYMFPLILVSLILADYCLLKREQVKLSEYVLSLLAVFFVVASLLVFISSFSEYLDFKNQSGFFGEIAVVFLTPFFGGLGVLLLSGLSVFVWSAIFCKGFVFPVIKSVIDSRKVAGEPESVKAKKSKRKNKSVVNTGSASVKSVVKGLLPKVELLTIDDAPSPELSRTEKLKLISDFESSMSDFNIKGKVVDVITGPVITRLIVDLSPGVKVTSVVNVSVDMARSLRVHSIRVVDVIPGTSSIGVEIPNKVKSIVRLHSVLKSSKFSHSKFALPIAIGMDVTGKPYVFDLAKTPHLLVAGTTGSGKSVGVNAMILSLLYKLTPEDLRFVMIDPKMLELSVYSGIPHLYTDVITDMSKANNALAWCVGEMEKRYELMSKHGVRNVESFNEKFRESKKNNESFYDLDGSELSKHLPYIVVIIDEFADLMMVIGKKVEENICRLAQKSRAAGIHLIIATQRPSVDVVTGLIKSNIPSRMAFQVSSKINSRTVLDQSGAEQLLGMGDMLVSIGGSNNLERVHGAFIDDDEVHRVVSVVKLSGEPDYFDLSPQANLDSSASGVDEGDEDIYMRAIELLEHGKPFSISKAQRHLKIGYNRAARIVENLEENGVLIKDEKGARVAHLS